MVKIDILTGHEEKGHLHFNLKIIFHCICIEKPYIFSKLVWLIINEYHIAERNFVRMFISEITNLTRETISKVYIEFSFSCFA